MKIRLVSLVLGGPTPIDGKWLKSFDPEAYGGRGDVRGTDKREEAMEFATFAEAMEFYRAVPRSHPTRRDGRPNRPLTAFTVEILPDGEEPIG